MSKIKDTKNTEKKQISVTYWETPSILLYFTHNCSPRSIKAKGKEKSFVGIITQNVQIP